MKNLLIVTLVLMGCFAVAVFLVLFPTQGGNPRSSGLPYMIAEWRDFGDPGVDGVEVSVGTDRMTVDVPASPQFKRYTEKGRWSGHTFYCDSHLDVPPEIAIARELPNEDLEVDLGHFLPNRTGTFTCVKTERIIDDERPLYPQVVPGQTVTYPPPKGLIHDGMLACDLETLPWHADKIENAAIANLVNEAMSDRGHSSEIYARYKELDADSNPPQLYTYHSDRPGLTSLLVTVQNGRVIKVTGGAEESDDPPYHLPPREAPAADADSSRTWSRWLWEYFFTK